MHFNTALLANRIAQLGMVLDKGHGKQKHLRYKKVVWPRKTATKRSDMRVWPRLTMHLG